MARATRPARTRRRWPPRHPSDRPASWPAPGPSHHPGEHPHRINNDDTTHQPHEPPPPRGRPDPPAPAVGARRLARHPGGPGRGPPRLGCGGRAAATSGPAPRPRPQPPARAPGSAAGPGHRSPAPARSCLGRPGRCRPGGGTGVPAASRRILSGHGLGRPAQHPTHRTQATLPAPVSRAARASAPAFRCGRRRPASRPGCPMRSLGHQRRRRGELKAGSRTGAHDRPTTPKTATAWAPRSRMAGCWQTTHRAEREDGLCLVEPRRFEPLTPCMPLTSRPRTPHHLTRRSHTSALLSMRMASTRHGAECGIVS